MKKDNIESQKNQEEPSEAWILLWLTTFIVSVIAIKVIFFGYNVQHIFA